MFVNAVWSSVQRTNCRKLWPRGGPRFGRAPCIWRCGSCDRECWRHVPELVFAHSTRVRPGPRTTSRDPAQHFLPPHLPSPCDTMDSTSPPSEYDCTPDQTAGLFGLTGCLLLLGWIYLCLEFNQTFFLIVIICQVAWFSTFWSFWESEFWQSRNSAVRNLSVRVVVDYGSDREAEQVKGRYGLVEVGVEKGKRRFDATFGEEMEDFGVWVGGVRRAMAGTTVADVRKDVAERWKSFGARGTSDPEERKGNTGWKKMV